MFIYAYIIPYGEKNVQNEGVRLMDYEYIVVETDEENPITIATISNEDIDCIKGYRVRVKPI